ncbi:hypothetical protein DENIS_3454 [Desulfonema ishimotonii]|uniref:Tip attachment protein J domain-containing protein n=1 Tax=Desulfonema ishimotonii TaxID=45657 RepID=A0A401FZR5_9BACT|nr:hypothetical protein [Desulfonema ishimotonii]GBC62482.1 hypothetical protein DENIS_3454 [Desulfonema ishimotonii]
MTTRKFWNASILSLPSLELRSNADGGYISGNYGSVTFAPDAFSGAPPLKLDVDLRFGITSATAFLIYKGSLLLREYKPLEITYDVWEPERTEKLLDEGTDENGDDCVLPLVIGTVNHMNPQRTGSDTTNTYHRPDFYGEIGTDWHAYDDGVLIDDNWTDNGDGTITRSVDIVGELTFSGTGNITNIGQLFKWACDRLSLTFQNLHGGDIPLDCVITSQEILISFLERVAWYCGYIFYLYEDEGVDVLRLVSLDQNNGVSYIEQFDAVSITYSWSDSRIKSYSAQWTVREAADGAIQEREIERKVFGQSAVVGEELELPYVFNEDPELVETRLDWILAYEEKPVVQMDIPLIRMPQPGEEVWFSDRRIQVDAVGSMRITNINLNYKEKSVTLQGRGDVTIT